MRIKNGLPISNALFGVEDFVRNYIDNNEKVMCIFLEVLKAFDSIDHK